MIISTREYLSLVKHGFSESMKQYQKEVERIDWLIRGAVQSSIGTLVPERYTEELEKIREKYNTQILLYEKERARCMINIQHLPTRNQSSAVYMYVMADKSWEQISIDRCTTFEAARSLVLRGFESYERLYGANQEIDERIYRA